MEIRKVNHNTFDVFLFSGWGGWSRVRKGQKGSFCVAGNRLSKPLLTQLDGVLSPKLNPSHGQQFQIVS